MNFNWIGLGGSVAIRLIEPLREPVVDALRGGILYIFCRPEEKLIFFLNKWTSERMLYGMDTSCVYTAE